MKLTSIKLCNFRSFYGRTPEIILAGTETCNTTIIHGNNGSGKTSLLNAFTWVLYEKFSAAFASTEQLVNKRAIAEAKPGQVVECWVELEWEAGLEMPVAASTGENQILSLSFIASIIDMVREWSEKKKMLLVPDSSTFPIVMDSPFGSLDQISRRQIAKTIPKLANQLIVLVSKTQWRGEVEEQIAERIGREYVLTYFSSKPDCEQDSIELGGERYPLVRQSPNEFEYTEIVEVNREG